ncbi:MAG TPA: hypothetical protein VLA31_05385 [Burkholderiaceae bacterium]|nr:hypothetical protein [Burkholderiaceae bacterium]
MTFLNHLGTAARIVGPIVVALNLPWSVWGFALLGLWMLIWVGVDAFLRAGELQVLQLVFTAINVMGILHWLVLLGVFRA